jgi:hypothetical protein
LFVIGKKGFVESAPLVYLSEVVDEKVFPFFSDVGDDLLGAADPGAGAERKSGRGLRAVF